MAADNLFFLSQRMRSDKECQCPHNPWVSRVGGSEDCLKCAEAIRIIGEAVS